MKKSNILILSALLMAPGFVGLTPSAQATPFDMCDQTAALLNSPVAQAPIQDPLVQKALEWLNTKQPVKDSKRTPGHTVSQQHPACDKDLILGGAEAFPM